MIGYLRGQVIESSEGKVLVLVSGGGATGGVGYSVSMPRNGPAPSAGSEIELFIHTHVREDALDLYGFASPLEKELFLTLLGVNGVGPKLALAILSAMEPAGVIQAILDEDKAVLTRIPGVGKRTAERLVLETSDRIRRKLETGAMAASRLSVGGPAPGKAAAHAAGAGGVNPSVINQSVFNDAKTALVGLGYRDSDMAALLNRVIADEKGVPAGAEGLVRAALRQLL